jgi:hypothetical protein
MSGCLIRFMASQQMLYRNKSLQSCGNPAENKSALSIVESCAAYRLFSTRKAGHRSKTIINNFRVLYQKDILA